MCVEPFHGPVVARAYLLERLVAVPGDEERADEDGAQRARMRAAETRRRAGHTGTTSAARRIAMNGRAKA